MMIMHLRFDNMHHKNMNCAFKCINNYVFIIFYWKQPHILWANKAHRARLYYIQEKVLKGVISIMHVTLFEKLGSIFTKPLKNISHDSLGMKLGIVDLYTQT